MDKNSLTLALGWKGFTVTNTLAYLVSSSVTNEASFLKILTWRDASDASSGGATTLAMLA
jgi:hypothetical protein